MLARILVVDDESVTRRLVTHTLKLIDVEAVGAADGKEALQLAEHSSFDLAIIDINLPDMDGFTLVGHLRALAAMQDVPILIFTARSHQGDEARSLDVGAVGLLYKPFSTQELRELVMKHLRTAN